MLLFAAKMAEARLARGLDRIATAVEGRTAGQVLALQVAALGCGALNS
jgi:hypothetical protein